jgi:bacteriorhodopsin
MADIDVVKKSSHAWLWIVIAVIAIIALFFFFSQRRETRNGFLDQDGGQPLAAAPPLAHAA